MLDIEINAWLLFFLISILHNFCSPLFLISKLQNACSPFFNNLQRAWRGWIFENHTLKLKALNIPLKSSFARKSQMWWSGRGNSGGSWLPEEKKLICGKKGKRGGSWPPAFPRSSRLINLLGLRMSRSEVFSSEHFSR